MFAVIKTGGKQYRVAADQTLKIQKLAGEPGDAVTFSDVLAHGGDSPKLGAPLIADASVVAEIVGHGRDGKIIIFKKRRRQNSRRKNGHRQDYTLIRVTDILTDGAKSQKPRKAKPVAEGEVAEAAAATAAPAKKPRARKTAKKDEAGARGAAE
jgi:large subunit ribosomal protein L21